MPNSMEDLTSNTSLDYLGGAIQSPEYSDDTIFEKLAEGPIGFYINVMPEEFDLRKHARPSRDQGRRGTCAAFAGTGIREIQAHRSEQFDDYLSPEFIYYHRNNKPIHGMHGRDVFQILQRYGSPPESAYPYNSAEHPSQELYDIAAKFKIANFAKVTTCDGLKKALLEIGPCYLQLPLYRSRPYFWRAKEGEKAVGGHAVSVVGYTKDGFILKNSWGDIWNEDGCIIFPYSEWGIQLECWVGIDYETSAKITPRCGGEVTVVPVVKDSSNVVKDSVISVDISNRLDKPIEKVTSSKSFRLTDSSSSDFIGIEFNRDLKSSDTSQDRSADNPRRKSKKLKCGLFGCVSAQNDG